MENTFTPVLPSTAELVAAVVDDVKELVCPETLEVLLTPEDPDEVKLVKRVIAMHHALSHLNKTNPGENPSFIS